MKFSRLSTFKSQMSLFRVAIGVFVLALGACAGSPGETKHDSSAKETTNGSDACRASIREAIRLHNAAVELVNANRAQLAVNSFDQAILEWQRVTDGSLNCPRDAITRANDGLQDTQRERERALQTPP